MLLSLVAGEDQRMSAGVGDAGSYAKAAAAAAAAVSPAT
jgi:hypothetical protein